MAKVLVIDDEKELVKLFSQVVVFLNHIPIAANNGEEALEKLKDHPDVSLIITDILMPKMNGKDFINKVRLDDRYENIPIIVISGFLGKTSISDILSMKDVCFLPKPLSLKKLKEVIQNRIQ